MYSKSSAPLSIEITLDKTHRFQSALCALIGLSLAGCTGSSLPPDSTLSKYHNVAVLSRNNTSIAGLRYQSLRDTALSTGARAGLAWRSKQINQLISKHERQLDLVFNFNAMLLEDNVLPPVLLEGRQTLDQSANDIIRISDRQYVIQAQARFVTMAPTWREYLLTHYKEPDVPDTSLLPKNSEEKTVWDRYIDEGWQAGISQADIIFSENLGRLKRDYEGMVRYKTLLAQNMVSKPFVAHTNLGVTGGNSQMAINDRILRITALPGFNTDSEEWHAEVTPDTR